MNKRNSKGGARCDGLSSEVRWVRRWRLVLLMTVSAAAPRRDESSSLMTSCRAGGRALSRFISDLHWHPVQQLVECRLEPASPPGTQPQSLPSYDRRCRGRFYGWSARRRPTATDRQRRGGRGRRKRRTGKRGTGNQTDRMRFSRHLLNLSWSPSNAVYSHTACNQAGRANMILKMSKVTIQDILLC